MIHDPEARRVLEDMEKLGLIYGRDQEMWSWEYKEVIISNDDIHNAICVPFHIAEIHGWKDDS